MFGGSGSFTIGYINYLNEKYNINWKNELDKIHHYDMNEDVIKLAALEFFCITGVLPNMKSNLHYTNSMNDEFNDKKYKYIITKLPHGSDKKNVSDAHKKRNRIKKYIKQFLLNSEDDDLLEQLKDIEIQEKKYKIDNAKVCLKCSSVRAQKYAKINKLKANDKDSVSLIVTMDLLENDGTCIGILPFHLFHLKKYINLRKCLVENFNIREVINIQSFSFKNTLTQTSIIIFDNTNEKTTNVKFYDLVIDRYEEDIFEKMYNRIELIKNKDDIKNISEKFISKASREDLLNNSKCSLNARDYR